MSDDIVFGDLTVREPKRMRRPDRDPDCAVIAYMHPGPEDLPIFLDLRPADAIERHALRDTSVELGGILLGHECIDDETGKPFVHVTESLEAKHYENTQASFTYTHDSWAEITREREEKYPSLDIVGWYHTHPDFGVFLSSYDLFIQDHFFGQPLQLAYVVDPIRQDRGFFHRRDDVMQRVEGFYLVAPRAERARLARFVNDLENVPDADPPPGGGLFGGMSPRMEAELIAMLTRPNTSAAPPDRGQAAATYGLLGVVLGGLLMAGLFQLQSLSRSVEDQKRILSALGDVQTKEATQKAESARLAGLEAKEAALDALLHEVKVGARPERFVAIYEETARERDEARREAAESRTLHDALKAFDTRLRNENVSLQEQLAKRDKDLESAAAETRSLREKLGLEDGAPAEASLGAKSIAGVLRERYTYAWYAAVGGWTACILLALGLVAAVARKSPEDPIDGPRGGVVA